MNNEPIDEHKYLAWAGVVLMVIVVFTLVVVG